MLRIEYNSTALLLTGDSDWKCWKEKIIPNFGDSVHSEILLASHHGSRSFFTAEENEHIDINENPDSTYIESIDYIAPDIVLISCGSYDTMHHPNKEALKIYQNNSKNEQVYSTYNKGHLAGYIDNHGNYTVVPLRFQDSRTAASAFKLNVLCTYEKNGTSTHVSNGQVLPIGGKLRFSIETSGGIISPINQVSILWEVSNGGTGPHKEHQEIYYKGENESDGILNFSRDLSFVGTHLLRCRLTHHKYGQITRIFCVKGR